MKTLSATEAARRFSELLDSVEHDGECFVVVRRGRAVARIEPASTANGVRVKELIRRNRPDRSWADDLQSLRSSLAVEDRRWNG